MESLSKTLRSKLENDIKKAREIAEAGAKIALQQMGVDAATALPHLTGDQLELRRKMRAHARQLGDKRDPKKETQEITRLTEEVAYEHWHRMLFSRFLAENDLLMYPDPNDPVSISIEDCKELAADEGARNEWELAARFASQMLPQIFRADSPAFQLSLPPEYQQKLEHLLAAMSHEVFTATDSLGWVYQFWQAKRKDQINQDGGAVGARELSPVTQLFTEDYMVWYLLDNSLGAWWAKRKLTEDDLRHAPDEQTLRNKLALPGAPFNYLRFIKNEETQSWQPAGGWYEGWPDALSELKVLDPSCGSGHFLVFAFQMLVPMRMELESLTAQEAADAVLRDNLNGLELDQRCVELAAFALALTAWTYPEAEGYRTLPELNIACSGLAVTGKVEDWVRVAKQSVDEKHHKEQIEEGMRELYRIFQDAPTLGSLIDPSKLKQNLFTADYKQLAELLERALRNEEHNHDEHELSVVAFGLAKAARMLADKYHWVITNVPYLGMKRMDDTLYEYCNENYPNSKADLATVFLERWVENLMENGTISLVMPQNWLFLTSYKKIRKSIIDKLQIKFIALLGSGAFETISGEVVKGLLFSISNTKPNNHDTFFGLDTSNNKSIKDKIDTLLNEELSINLQQDLKSVPDNRIIVDKNSNLPYLESECYSKRGIVNGDNERWIKRTWEFDVIDKKSWRLLQTAPSNNLPFSGRDSLIDWRNEGGGMLRPGLDNPTYGNQGIALNRMGSLNSAIYTGEFYDQNSAVLIPKKKNNLVSLYCYASSTKMNEEVRKIDKKLGVTPATFLKIPFDLEHWQKVAEEKYPNGLPLPYSDDPTQWIFHGHPVKAEEETRLQVATTRLLGYRWPAEYDFDKKQKGENEGIMELSEEAWQHIEEAQALNALADDDGIVCIPAVRGEQSAADRLIEFLEAAYAEKWNNNTLAELLTAVGHSGKSLESWLRDKFFMQHCKLFHHHPFIWHIWDGLNDGFAAYVNYHQLDYKTLETLIYTYLGDWMSEQEQAKANNIDGAEEKLAAAENLKKQLEAILKGEAPLDIFVRWKSLEKQPLGWNPDINDGVRMNIRPFMLAKDMSKKDAGVLRIKPNIKWGKDRGTDVETAPWYSLGLEYGGKQGDRINDHHTTLQEKTEARNGN
jgi:hypothetical protein